MHSLEKVKRGISQWALGKQVAGWQGKNRLRTGCKAEGKKGLQVVLSICQSDFEFNQH
jgi:hypothetical protein